MVGKFWSITARDFLAGVAIGTGIVVVIGLAAWATVYTPPLGSGRGGALTEDQYYGDWSSLSAFLNGKIGGSNITASDPIPISKLDLTAGITDAMIQSVSISKFTSLKAMSGTVASPGTPTTKVRVLSGWYLSSDGLKVVNIAADRDSPSFSTPGTSRIDALCFDDDGTLGIVKGVDSATPRAPVIPGNRILVAYITMKGGTPIYQDQATAGTNSYITDARPIISSPRAGPGLRVSAGKVDGTQGMWVHITKGWFTKSDGSGVQTLDSERDLPAAFENIAQSPGTGVARIDLVCIRDDGTVYISKGVEAVENVVSGIRLAPVPPNYPSSAMVLAEVVIRKPSTYVVDNDLDGSTGFISKDSRPLLRAGATGVASQTGFYEHFNYDLNGDGTLEIPPTVGGVCYTGCPGACSAFCTIQSSDYGSGNIVVNETLGSVMRITDSTVTDGKWTGAISLRNSTLALGGMAFETRVKIENYPGIPANARFLIGLTHKPNIQTQTYMIGFLASTADKNHLVLKVCKNGNCASLAEVQPSQSTLFTVESWHIYRIEATKASVKFYVDGTLVNPGGTIIVDTDVIPDTWPGTTYYNLFLHPSWGLDTGGQSAMEIDYASFYATDDAYSQ